MDSDEKYEKPSAFFDNLSEALAEMDCTQEEALADLMDEGVNVDAEKAQFIAFIKKCSISAKLKKLDEAAEARSIFDSKKKDVPPKLIRSREEILSRIRQLISFQSASAVASFRDMESKNKEDLESILEDLEICMERKLTEESEG